MSKTISIIGCGWLGLPLGSYLVEKGYDVKFTPNALDIENLPQGEDRRYKKQIIYAARLSEEKGILNGSFISYYENNKIHEKGNMLNGKKNGDWVTKYYDGAIKSIYNYKDSLVTPFCHICNEYKKCKAVINATGVFADEVLQITNTSPSFTVPVNGIVLGKLLPLTYN